MKMKMTRWIGMLLVVVLLTGLLPVSAFAAPSGTIKATATLESHDGRRELHGHRLFQRQLVYEKLLQAQPESGDAVRHHRRRFLRQWEEHGRRDVRPAPGRLRL